jgi:hypothetical protein
MRSCVCASCSCRESGTIRSSPSCDVKGIFMEGNGLILTDGFQDPRSGPTVGLRELGVMEEGCDRLLDFFF